MILSNKVKCLKYRDKNIDKKKEYAKEYYENNKDKKIEYSKKYYEDNKEKKKEYTKEYYENNKDRIKERKKEYYENNEDKMREYHKEYGKSSALYNTYVNQISYVEATRCDPENEELLQIKCAYCGKWFNPTTASVKNRIAALNGTKTGEYI